MKPAESVLSDQGRRLISVSPDLTLRATIRVMNAEGIGAILVKQGSKFVGIWTERDLLRAAEDEQFDPDRMLVGDRMTRTIVTVRHDEPLHKLKDKFLGLRLRHLLVEKDGEPIGLISAGDAMRASLNDQATELESLNRMVSWDYYENWGWTPARGSGSTRPVTRGSATSL